MNPFLAGQQFLLCLDTDSTPIPIKCLSVEGEMAVFQDKDGRLYDYVASRIPNQFKEI